MKLPDVVYTRRVGSLGKRNPFLPVSDANVNVAGAKAVAGAADAVYKSAGISYANFKQKRDREYQHMQKVAQVENEVAREMIIRNREMKMGEERKTLIDSEQNIQIENGTKEFYTGADLEANGIYLPETEDPDKEYPAALYRPNVMRNQRQAALEASLSNIQNPDDARQLKLQTEEYIAKQYTKDILAADKLQKNEHKAQVDQTINSLVNNGQHRLALQAASEYPGTESEIYAREMVVKKRMELDPANAAIASGNLVLLEQQYMKFKNPKYNNEAVTDMEHRAIATNLRNALHHATAGDRAAQQAAQQALADQGRRAATTLNEGGKIDVRTYTNTMNQIATFNPAVAKRMELSLAISELPAILVTAPPPVRDHFMRNLTEISKNDMDAAYVATQVGPGVTAMNSLQNTDPATFGLKYNLTEEVPFDTQDLENTIARLNGNDNTLRDLIGNTKSIFTNNQKTVFQDYILDPTKSSNDKVLDLAKVYKAMGDDKWKLNGDLDRLGTLNVAADLQTKNNSQAALAIGRGREKQSQYPHIFDKIKLDLKDEITSIVGTSYAGDPNTGPLVNKAIEQVYLDLLTPIGGQEPDLTPDRVDNDILEQAANMVLGGELVEINGVKTRTAYPGQSKYDLQNYMVTLPERFIDNSGGMKNFTPARYRRELKDGNITFVRDDRDMYVGVYNGQIIQNAKTGGAFYIPPKLEGKYLPANQEAINARLQAKHQLKLEQATKSLRRLNINVSNQTRMMDQLQ